MTGGPDEKTDSEAVCKEIWDYITEKGRFGYCSDYWGFDTQPDFVYNTTQYYSDNYDDAWVFYKGHSIPTNCPYGWCGFPVHRAIYDNEGKFPASPDECIQDYRIFESQYIASGFRHRFVFLWTCGYGRANETGAFYSYWPIEHSWGMMASWLGTTSLLPNAWNNADNSGLCFISFEPYSAWFVMGTDYPGKNFGDFAANFYEEIANGFSVSESLNRAAEFAFGAGKTFATCKLNEGYPMPNPDDLGATNVTSYMRVWGDGDIVMPS